MKSRASNPFRSHFFALAALLAAPLAHAADGTWNGISGNWSDSTDPSGVWLGGIFADGADFTANFTGVDIAADQVITLDAARTIGNITFTDFTTASNDLTISGANVLTLDRTTGVPILDVTQTGRKVTIASVVTGADGLQKDGPGSATLSALNTFTGPLTINGGTLDFSNLGSASTNVYLSTQININNGSTLRISGGTASNIPIYDGKNYTFDSNGGGSILVSTGNYNAGTTAFSIATNGGARNNIGLITTSGPFGFNVGTGTTGVTFDVALGTDATSDLTVTPIIVNSAPVLKTGAGRLHFTATNTYTGSTTIANGTLLVTGVSTGTPAAQGASGSSRLGNGSATNTLIFTGGTLKAGSVITSPAARTVNLTSTGIFDTNTFAVSIAGIMSGAGGVTKIGAGDLTLSGANTYTGTTTLNAGRVIAALPTHLSSGATSIVQSGNAQAFLSGAGIYANPCSISTIGYPEIGDSQNNINGAIRLNGGTMSGQVTLTGNSRIGGFRGAAGLLTHTINSKITGAFGIDFYGFQNLANTGNVFLLGNTANDYTGDTTIYNSNYNTTNLAGVSTTLRLGASNVIPDGASAGKVAFAISSLNNNATVILDLNGFNETINGVTVNAGTFATRITNTAAAASSVLSIGANDTSSTFSGTIADSGAGRTLALSKIGTGTLTLSGANTYIGATSVSAGTLALVGGSQASAITVDSGASLDFTLGSSVTSNSTVDLTNGTVKITGVPTLPSYLLMTASSIAGTPALFTAIPGYTLVKANGNTELRLDQSGGSNFAAWQTANSTLQTIDQDHDNDGVSNGVEFFLFGPVSSTGFTALPGVTNSAGTLSITWTKAAGYTGVYGTDFFVETSATLAGAWATEITSPTSGFTVTFPTANEVTFTFPAGTKNFARLKVTGP